MGRRQSRSEPLTCRQQSLVHGLMCDMAGYAHDEQQPDDEASSRYPAPLALWGSALRRKISLMYHPVRLRVVITNYQFSPTVSRPILVTADASGLALKSGVSTGKATPPRMPIGTVAAVKRAGAVTRESCTLGWSALEPVVFLLLCHSRFTIREFRRSR